MNPFIKKFLVKEYVTLYPLGDFHYGSPQCDEGFIKRHVNRIKNDPTAICIMLGDLTENVLIDSAGNIYEQIKNPHSQVNEIVDILKPIKDKILFGVESNHSIRTFERAGISIDKLICDALGVPFKGYSCYARLFVSASSRKESSFCYQVYCHHNSGGGITKGGKINAQKKLSDIVPTADAIISAHTHMTSRVIETYKDFSNGSLINKYRYLYSIGSALTWDESYAERKAYPPAVKEFISIKLYAPLNGHSVKKQGYDVYEN